jgi:hypothetical protein
MASKKVNATGGTPPSLPEDKIPSSDKKKAAAAAARKRRVRRSEAQESALKQTARGAVEAGFIFFDELDRRNKATAAKSTRELVPMMVGMFVWTGVCVAGILSPLGVPISIMLATGSGITAWLGGHTYFARRDEAAVEEQRTKYRIATFEDPKTVPATGGGQTSEEEAADEQAADEEETADGKQKARIEAQE